MIDLPLGDSNSLIYGSDRPLTDSELKQRALSTGDPYLSEIAGRAWTLREVREATEVYTDDLAPVERLIDNMIVREAVGGAGGRTR